MLFQRLVLRKVENLKYGIRLVKNYYRHQKLPLVRIVISIRHGITISQVGQRGG